ncbi:hypothetical protein DC522_21735 [Microvirga sp. KLBC 81]|uniref:hypothetical protein n=1 Tax=Microvirga sp. KLBC 81 TaxID=1862707 RepID=UPI000D51DB7F|nr:hypothetical protein [Microvirga sp. KLBC 81]PVE22306.1 hypothetical protein DC522_21735 [Microvirga sp. KLBC 81]
MPSIIMGKLRKLAALRRRHGIPINLHGWAQVIAAELDDFNLVSLRHQCCRIGLANLASHLAQEIIAREQERRQRGRHLSLKQRGELLELTTAERDAIDFWLAYAIDETPEAGRKRRARERAQTAEGAAKNAARNARRKERDRNRKAAQRLAEGRPTQEDRSRAAAERRAAIEASGLSQASYYRQLKKAENEKVGSAENVGSTREHKRRLNRSNRGDTISKIIAHLERANRERDVRLGANITLPVPPPPLTYSVNDRRDAAGVIASPAPKLGGAVTIRLKVAS